MSTAKSIRRSTSTRKSRSSAPAAAAVHLRFPVEQVVAAAIRSFRTPTGILFSATATASFTHARSGGSKIKPSLRRRPLRPFRNRLTHTIEVSQIARTVAGVLGLDEDLTEALALAHDVGHPPFAHAGEVQLDLLMRPFGARFEHNLHALRIVESFENRYARFPGLNLTFEVREGIVKHSRDFEPGEIPELDEYLPGLRPPLEAQLIDMCDEIAYDTADLDDAFYAGLVTVDDASRDVVQFGEFHDQVTGQFPGASERVRMHETVRALINWLVSGLVEGTVAAAAGLASVGDVRAASPRVARFTPRPPKGPRNSKVF